MKDLTETAISILLAVLLLAAVYSLYTGQLIATVTRSFDLVPK
jgi:hypothetical protein